MTDPPPSSQPTPYLEGAYYQPHCDPNAPLQGVGGSSAVPRTPNFDSVDAGEAPRFERLLHAIFGHYSSLMQTLPEGGEHYFATYIIQVEI